MKRFTAILTVFCFAWALFSCSSGGTATTATSPSTAAQNTTEYTKPESTTSKTEELEKPVFLHPAMEEINEGIDKTLSKDNFCAAIDTEISAESQNKTIDSLYHGVSITASGMNTESPAFLLKTVTSEKYTEETDTSIYFGGGSYYISELGVKAKIPPSGVQGIVTSPKDLLRPLLVKINSDDYRVLTKVGEKENVHHLQANEPDAGDIFSDIVKAMSDAISQNTAREFTLRLEKAEFSFTVNADGYLERHENAMVFSLVFSDGVENSELTLIVNTHVAFINMNSESAPQAPEDIASYTELNSQNEIPLLLLSSAASKTAALESYEIRELLDINKKELNGSRVNISLSSQKTYSSARWLENAVLETVGKNDPKNISTYFDGNFFFVKNGNDTARYSAEDFKSKFLYSGSAPCIPLLEISDVLSYTIRSGKGGEESFSVSITLTDEAFTQKFAEYIGRAARYTVEQYDIWSFKAKNNRITFSVGADGYVEKCEMIFDLEVIANINGSKFAFSSAVSDTVTFTAPGEEAQVTPPKWAEELSN